MYGEHTIYLLRWNYNIDYYHLILDNDWFWLWIIQNKDYIPIYMVSLK